ncbi:YHS domain-containing (seleno)protein [Bradyrhizobium sp.]|uniref:YHS domain-containing (seleno)protein n=1 Tax=Bradyrhizobium sp. TaxID=376 RepID=UPI0026039835|nr:YHS domain-containing (seleno)protein [Bradyrhizobium sp.]
MTPERQEANRIAARPHFRPQIALIALALVAALWPAAEPAGSGSALAATTERVVTNRYSGLAIEGFDPLAYFVDHRPEMGSPDFEAAQGGAVWRFTNEGNRASFVAHPDVYGPQFGGYDPVDLARGVTVGGSPMFWLVAGDRLYLFGREETRDAFAANPAPYAKEATARWPSLEEQLAQ